MVSTRATSAGASAGPSRPLFRDNNSDDDSVSNASDDAYIEEQVTSNIIQSGDDEAQEASNPSATTRKRKSSKGKGKEANPEPSVEESEAQRKKKYKRGTREVIQEADNIVDGGQDSDVAMAYALRVGPALSHSTSMALNWAALSVQSNLILTQCFILEERLMGKNTSSLNEDDLRKHNKALAHIERMRELYDAQNSIAAIRDPYVELQQLWNALHSDPNISPVAEL